jgi:predicted nucleic acid-binding protein
MSAEQRRPSRSEGRGLVFLDTNVLVYFFDKGEPEKRQTARYCVRELVRDDRAVLSTQVLQEFYVAVTRKLAIPVPGHIAEEAVREWSRLPLVQLDSALILAGIARSRAHQLSLWAALIVEAALHSGASLLYSEDFADGRGFGDLRVQNPFRPTLTP